jgi:hypothetical protein
MPLVFASSANAQSEVQATDVLESFSTTGAVIEPLTPARIADTRFNQGIVGKMTASRTAQLKVTGVGGVPTVGVGSIVLNLTVTGASATSYVTAYPTGGAQPPTSNINFTAGQTTANTAILKVGAGGFVSLFNESGSTDLIVDVLGWVPEGVAFEPLNPARVADTRTGVGIVGAMSAKRTAALKVTGVGGVPETGVGSVVVNLTAAGASAASYITAYPAGGLQPATSNINFSAGQTTANMAILKVGTGGVLNFFNDAGSTQLIVDVLGWIPDTSPMRSLIPARIADTRGNLGISGAMGANRTAQLKVTGVGGVPAAGVGSVVINLTVTGPTASSYMTAYPAGGAQPPTSNINFAAGQTTANMAILKVGAGGLINLFNESGSAHLIVDILGYIPEGTTPATTALRNTKLVGTADVLGVIGDSNKGGEITLSNSSDVPAVGGYILLAVTRLVPGGAFGKVVSVSRSGANWIVSFIPAPLDEGVLVNTLNGASVGQAQVVDALGQSLEDPAITVQGYDENGALVSATQNQSLAKQVMTFTGWAITCSGGSSLGLKPFLEFTFSTVEVDAKSPDLRFWSYDPSASFHFLAQGSIRVGADLTASSSIDCHLSDAFTNSLKIRMPFAAGPIPIVATLSPQMNFAAAANLRATFAKNYNFLLGFDASTQTTPQIVKSVTAGAVEPISLSANVSASLEVGLRIEVLVAGVAGGFVDFGPGIKASGFANSSGQACWNLDGYFWLKVGLTLNLWVKNFKTTVFNDHIWDGRLGSGCLVNPTAPAAPTSTGTVINVAQPAGTTVSVGSDGQSGWIYIINGGSFPGSNIRNGPSLGNGIVKTLPNGTAVRILCRVAGDTVYGTNIWNKLEDGNFVHDSGVNTPVPTPVAICSTAPTTPPPTGGSSPYSVTAGSYGAANIRSSPALSAAIVRTAPNGEVLQLVCQTTGDFAYGINIWNRLADNTFVHDSAVNTPVPNPLPVCGGSPPPPPPTGVSYTVTAGSFGAANIRSAPSLSAAIVRTAPNGAVLQLVCQTTGDVAFGTNIWNRLANNTFVHDSAVNTPVPNPLPFCA